MTARDLSARAEAASRSALSQLWHVVPRQVFSGGNTVRLLRGGDALFPAMVEAIAAARHEVCLATYIFHDDHGAAAVAEALVAAASRGVVVKVVLPGRYDRLSLIAYIALGWVGVLAIGPARASLPGVSLGLIVAGGLTYVAGVAFYKWHALRFHNAIWHLFVAIAAGLHFAAVALAVAQ